MPKLTKALGIIASALLISAGAAEAWWWARRQGGGAAAAFGVHIGDLTIITNRLTAAGCACGFCAMVTRPCGSSGAAGNAEDG